MRKLNLNREIYSRYIQEDLSKTFQYSIDEKPNNLKICKFLKTGENQAQLNIYENNDGTTTLQHSVGKNPKLSKEIAEKLVAVSSVKTFKSQSFYIKAIRDEDFDNLIEILIEYGNTIEENKTINKKRTIKINGKQGDKIVITKHSNNSFQVQGKPMLLFNDIIEVLSEYMPFEEIIQQQLSFYETNLTTSDIRGELEAKLPNSYTLLDNKLKIIITPCLSLQKINVILEDYSVFAYPILRAIEGVLKQMFLKYGKKIAYKEGFRNFIIKDGVDYRLEQEFQKEVNNLGISTKICKLYKYYNIHRHSLFHIDEDIISSKTISLQEANNIVSTSLSIIDDCYECLK
ncbi:type II toxin-antitoxin system RnlA family toxin [Cellulophaga sp. Ld12]|uniref:type II toxin-antitoxin system RnlA family toxin n=1 Tax=Cellulophaga sp. Ld12 TaxID=3229535 RepID=UPI0038705BBB